MINRESVLEKVKKILAKANNNPSQEEAQTALLMAQKLMAQHNIEMKEVSAKEEKKEAEYQVIKEGNKATWKLRLAKLITKNFRTSYLLRGTEGFVFIGEQADLELTIELFNFYINLIEQGAKKIRRKYRKEGLSTDGIAGDYITGFLKGLEDKLQEQVNKEGWALIVVTPEAVVEKTKKMTSGTVKRRSTLKTKGDQEAFKRGYQDGRSLSKDKHLK